MFNRFGHRLDFLSSLSDRLLLALLAVAIIPLGIVGLGGAAIARQVVEGESGRGLTGLARGLAAQLDLQTQGLLDDGRAIGSRPALRFLGPETRTSALAGAREREPHRR